MWIVLRAQPVPLAGDVLPILSLRSKEDLEQFVKGSDIDLGEFDSVHLMRIESLLKK